MAVQDRPEFIAHWSELEAPDEPHYKGDPERMGIDASLGRRLGLARIGIHHVRLLPGRRTSYPHAESAEEDAPCPSSSTASFVTRRESPVVRSKTERLAVSSTNENSRPSAR